MSAGLGSIDAAMSRIASIESRFGSQREQQLNTIQSAAFDPFGDVYEQAMSAVQSSGATAAGSSVATFGSSNGVQFNGGSLTRGYGTRAMLSGSPSVQAAINGVATTPGHLPIGGYGKMPVPPELAAHGNGQIPRAQLTEIGQNGHRLYAPAAAAWDNVVATAAADGIDLRITDSYRSYEQQVDLVRRKGLYSEGGLGAKPGTSNHGWGLAVDANVNDPSTLEWMRVNAPRFGFVEAVPREPWHWEFRPHQV